MSDNLLVIPKGKPPTSGAPNSLAATSDPKTPGSFLGVAGSKGFPKLLRQDSALGLSGRSKSKA